MKFCSINLAPGQGSISGKRSQTGFIVVSNLSSYSIPRLGRCNERAGVCKVITTFQTEDGEKEGRDTGWLINESTVFTVAHNLYGPNGSYAVEVKVEMGITKNNDSRNHETRQDKFVTIHGGYFAIGKRQYDVAIIKLEGNPISGLRPIPCKTAPLIEVNTLLRVVGYPGDLPTTGSHQGSAMIEQDGPSTDDLKNADFLLHHELDTADGLFVSYHELRYRKLFLTPTGHSGSPIFEVDTSGGLSVIAVHSGGGDSCNEAAPLGHNGSDIDAFHKAIRTAEHGVADSTTYMKPVPNSVPGLQKITVPL